MPARIAETETPSADATRPLIDALKRVLKARGLTYADLAKPLRLSEASVKRVFSQRTLTLARLLQICAVLELELVDLAKLARAPVEHARTLSEDQEAALAADPKLLLVFHLLLAGWRRASMRERYALSAEDCERALLRLARLNLIELGARERIHLRVPRAFSWRRDGPMRQRYGLRAMGELLNAPFAREDEVLRFEVAELSPTSLSVLRRKADRFAEDFAELVELDATLGPERRESVGMVLALRPWTFSLARSLKRGAS